MNGLAVVHQALGELALARPLYERALAIVEKLYDPQHPDVAAGLNNLALLLEDEGKPAEALPLYERSLAIKEAILEPNHPSVASTLRNIAVLLDGQPKHLKRARDYAKRARDINEAARPDHPTAEASSQLSDHFKAQRRCRTCDQLHLKMMTCGGCQNEWYCSVECQSSDWSRHKGECRVKAADQAAAALNLTQK